MTTTFAPPVSHLPPTRRDDPGPYRWSREEYMRLTDEGWFAGRRVQLIEGEIVEMAAQKRPHAISVTQTVDSLRKAFGEGHTVESQMPLFLSDGSAPEPDVYILRGRSRDYVTHPSTALLVVEVSDTTLAFDLRRKGPLYARAGIPEYWVIDIPGRRVHVHRDPRPADATWGETTTYLEDASITPLARADATIAVCDLLP